MMDWMTKTWCCKSCCGLEAAGNTQLQEHRTLSSLDYFAYLCCGQGSLQPMSILSLSAHNTTWLLSQVCNGGFLCQFIGRFLERQLLNNRQCSLYKIVQWLRSCLSCSQCSLPLPPMAEHMGGITQFQQEKTEGPRMLNSHPTLGNYFCLVKPDNDSCEVHWQRGLHRSSPYQIFQWRDPHSGKATCALSNFFNEELPLKLLKRKKQPWLRQGMYFIGSNPRYIEIICKFCFISTRWDLGYFWYSGDELHRMASHVNFHIFYCRNSKQGIPPNMHVMKHSHCSAVPSLFTATS